MRAEAMQRAVLHIPRQQAVAASVLAHQEVEREILGEELSVVLEALLIEGMQDSMPGAVSCRAGALSHLLALADGLAAEGALIDSAVAGPREGNAIVFELEYGGRGLAAHVLDRILVPKPVGPLDRVVHVVAPIIPVPHVSERGRHAALRRHGMTSRRKDLGHTCRS